LENLEKLNMHKLGYYWY